MSVSNDRDPYCLLATAVVPSAVVGDGCLGLSPAVHTWLHSFVSVRVPPDPDRAMIELESTTEPGTATAWCKLVPLVQRMLVLQAHLHCANMPFAMLGGTGAAQGSAIANAARLFRCCETPSRHQVDGLRRAPLGSFFDFRLFPGSSGCACEWRCLDCLCAPAWLVALSPFVFFWRS